MSSLAVSPSSLAVSHVEPAAADAPSVCDQDQFDARLTAARRSSALTTKLRPLHEICSQGWDISPTQVYRPGGGGFKIRAAQTNRPLDYAERQFTVRVEGGGTALLVVDRGRRAVLVTLREEPGSDVPGSIMAGPSWQQATSTVAGRVSEVRAVEQYLGRAGALNAAYVTAHGGEAGAVAAFAGQVKDTRIASVSGGRADWHKRTCTIAVACDSGAALSVGVNQLWVSIDAFSAVGRRAACNPYLRQCLDLAETLLVSRHIFDPVQSVPTADATSHLQSVLHAARNQSTWRATLIDSGGSLQLYVCAHVQQAAGAISSWRQPIQKEPNETALLLVDAAANKVLVTLAPERCSDETSLVTLQPTFQAASDAVCASARDHGIALALMACQDRPISVMLAHLFRFRGGPAAVIATLVGGALTNVAYPHACEELAGDGMRDWHKRNTVIVQLVDADVAPRGNQEWVDFCAVTAAPENCSNLLRDALSLAQRFIRQRAAVQAVNAPTQAAQVSSVH